LSTVGILQGRVSHAIRRPPTANHDKRFPARSQQTACIYGGYTYSIATAWTRCRTRKKVRLRRQNMTDKESQYKRCGSALSHLVMRAELECGCPQKHATRAHGRRRAPPRTQHITPSRMRAGTSGCYETPKGPYGGWPARVIHAGIC
jgi:hypothetical protein